MRRGFLRLDKGEGVLGLELGLGLGLEVCLEIRGEGEADLEKKEVIWRC